MIGGSVDAPPLTDAVADDHCMVRRTDVLRATMHLSRLYNCKNLLAAKVSSGSTHNRHRVHANLGVQRRVSLSKPYFYGSNGSKPILVFPPRYRVAVNQMRISLPV